MTPIDKLEAASGISRELVFANIRTAEMVMWRHLWAWFLVKRFEYTLKAAASELNLKDHTSIMHALRSIESRLESDQITKILFNYIEERL